MSILNNLCPVSKKVLEQISDDINEYLIGYNTKIDGNSTNTPSYWIDTNILQEILLNRIDGLGIVK